MSKRKSKNSSRIRKLRSRAADGLLEGRLCVEKSRAAQRVQSLNDRKRVTVHRLYFVELDPYHACEVIESALDPTEIQNWRSGAKTFGSQNLGDKRRQVHGEKSQD